jgi:hypothetical protein
VKTLVFLLEEASAKVLIEGLLQDRLPEGWLTQFLVFDGKQDLERNLVRKLRSWCAPNTYFVVLRDQDASECKAVKARLVALVAESGRSALVRVACKELEAWILGDLHAVSRAFEEPSVVDHARKMKFREPDAVVRPVEALRQLIPSYQKVDGARRVGPLLDPSRNESQSFRAFYRGLERLWDEAG